MNKHTVIVIVCSIVIVSTIGYSILNLILVDNLQFRDAKGEEFNLISLAYGGQLQVCNPVFLPVTFKKYQIDLIYLNEIVGTYFVDGLTLAPSSSQVVKGKFEAESIPVAGITSLALDTELQGRDVGRVDAKQFSVVTRTDTNIMGFIPYSITKQYSGEVFYELMNEKADEFAC